MTRSQSVRLVKSAGVSGREGSVEQKKKIGLVRPRSSTMANPAKEPQSAARTIQAGWRGQAVRSREGGEVRRGKGVVVTVLCVQANQVREELRQMRLEQHTKQLAKELNSARQQLQQERQLRKVQSDTIKVLWKEIQTLQMDNELEYGGGRQWVRRNRRVYEDSDSSRERTDRLSSSASDQDRQRQGQAGVAELSRTCAHLQTQVR